MRDPRHRTPSGFLYPAPLRPPPFRGDSYRLRGDAELGYVGNWGETDETRFRKYSDWSDGFLLRNFSLEGRASERSDYFELRGGSVGRKDQFYALEIGASGFWRVRSFYDSLSHVYADDARVLFEGVGGEFLSLPSTLTPGANTPAELQAALANTSESRISQDRNDSGVEIQMRLSPELNLSADYRLQRRTGERLFGGTLGPTFGTSQAGSVAELLEPIDSKTHDWSVGASYATTFVQGNISYRGSYYDNERDSLTWENPFPAVNFGSSIFPGPALGRSAVPPDNQLHQIGGDIGVDLPYRTRLTTTASWTRMRQDQKLLPATINPLVTTFSDLSRERADATVDQLLVRSKLRFRPMRRVKFQAGFRYFRRDSDTDYVAFNPTNGSFGYVAEDLGPTGRVAAPSFSYSKWSVEARSEWRLAKHATVGAEFEHEETKRQNRARRRVSDNRFRVNLSTRGMTTSTVRVAYEFLDRDGSDYDPSRDHDFYTNVPGSTVLAGPDRSLYQFRQFDLASQQRHTIDVRTNWLVGERVDLSLMGRVDTTDFGSSFGVRWSRHASVGTDLTYQASKWVDVRGFVNFDWRNSRFVTINSTTGAGGDFNAGGIVFPFANRWTWETESRTVSAGAGIEVRPEAKLNVSLDYNFFHSWEGVDTDFDRTGGALPFTTDPATAAKGFPSLRLIDHVVVTSIHYQWSDFIGTRLWYRFQYSIIDDFHQKGLGPLVNQNLYLAHVDDDFEAHVMGLTADLRF